MEGAWDGFPIEVYERQWLQTVPVLARLNARNRGDARVRALPTLADSAIRKLESGYAEKRALGSHSSTPGIAKVHTLVVRQSGLGKRPTSLRPNVKGGSGQRSRLGTSERCLG